MNADQARMIEITAIMQRAIEVIEAMPAPEPTDRDKTRAALALARRNRRRVGNRITR